MSPRYRVLKVFGRSLVHCLLYYLCREAGKKAEHEFFRLWQAAALPLDECSAASGEAHELGPTPNSPTSLLSPRDSMTASFLSGKVGKDI